MEISGFLFPETTEDSYYSPNIFTLDHNNIMTNNNDNKRRRTTTATDNNIIHPSYPKFDFVPLQNQQQQVISEHRPMSNNNEINEINNTSPHQKRTRAGGAVKMEDEAASSAGGSGGSSNWHSQRRLWVKSRSKAWWEQCDSADFPEEEFKKCFRMTKATFDVICRELEPVVNKKDTMLRLAIPVRQRVAVCIWRLATGEPLREVSKRFGLGISTCHKLILEVCKAIQDVLKPTSLHWPEENKLDEVNREFEMISGIPNVAGALYTTHIPIIAPKDKVAAYFNKKHTERNQKTSYSISVQGVVDSRGVFTDLSIGWPGSMPDEKVLEKSSLVQRAKMGLMKNVTLVGNSGHPLTDWVLAPYTHGGLTWTQHAFNEKVAEVQRVAKEAFMRLKARWSCLQKRTEMKLQDLPVVLMACCVLHNICEVNNEGLSEELRFELFDDEMVAEEKGVMRSVTAVQRRDEIAHKLLHYNMAGTSFL